MKNFKIMPIPDTHTSDLCDSLDKMVNGMVKLNMVSTTVDPSKVDKSVLTMDTLREAYDKLNRINTNTLFDDLYTQTPDPPPLERFYNVMNYCSFEELSDCVDAIEYNLEETGINLLHNLTSETVSSPSILTHGTYHSYTINYSLSVENVESGLHVQVCSSSSSPNGIIMLGIPFSIVEGVDGNCDMLILEKHLATKASGVITPYVKILHDLIQAAKSVEGYW